MIKRQYSKNSWYGRIFKYVHGYYPDSTTCGVRKAVFFQAPWKLFTSFLKFQLVWEIPVWVFLTAMAQIWLWRLFLAYPEYDDAVAVLSPYGERIGDFILFLALVNVPLTILEGALVLLVAPSIASDFVKGRDLSLAVPDMTFAKDWWDDVYHKICKPVTWAEEPEE